MVHTHTTFFGSFSPLFFRLPLREARGERLCQKRPHREIYRADCCYSGRAQHQEGGTMTDCFFFFVVVLLDVFFPLSNRKIGENGPCVTTTPGDAPSPFFLLRRRRLSVSRPPAGPLSDRQIDFPIEHSETFAFFSLFFYQPKNRKYRGGKKKKKKSTYKVDSDLLYVSAWEGIVAKWLARSLHNTDHDPIESP